jgi:hypothetical protein
MPERERAHLGRDVDGQRVRAPPPAAPRALPPAVPPLGGGGHRPRVAGHALAVERRLDDAALPPVERVLARQQPLAEHELEPAVREAAGEAPLLRDQHLAGELGWFTTTIVRPAARTRTRSPPCAATRRTKPSGLRAISTAKAPRPGGAEPGRGGDAAGGRGGGRRTWGKMREGRRRAPCPRRVRQPPSAGHCNGALVSK